MNIKKAKDQIRRAVTAYLMKDEYGDYLIPLEKQRPLFLMGPPGIGKTAIMEQIAGEMDLALISYSMTHHTRQSALGLPYIHTETYEGKEYRVSEYTMSEIISEIYRISRESGKKEGILFLDEINCVSETLAPSMLQFLQFKTFGQHRIPDGWIVVTAGNPPEYNHSVRDFDIVTWDRLKRIDVEPDFETWKKYAYSQNVHPSVMTYLELRPDDFYAVRSTVDGMMFVTARGWSDLSEMIRLYEREGFPVDEDLVRQYLQDDKIAKEFAVYYDLYRKYESDYQVQKILDGVREPVIAERAAAAGFDERYTLLGLLLDRMNQEFHRVSEQEAILRILRNQLKAVKAEMLQGTGKEAAGLLEKLREELRQEIHVGTVARSISRDEIRVRKGAGRMLEHFSDRVSIEAPESGEQAYDCINREFVIEIQNLQTLVESAGTHLSNLFRFIGETFGDGNEMTILMTELTAGKCSADFINRYGSEEYFQHNQDLQFYDHEKKIWAEIDTLFEEGDSGEA